MEDFIEQLAGVLNTPAEDITPEDKLADLPNWDSLAILGTLGMVDEAYGVTMSGADLQACTTVGDVHAKVLELRS
jgi:acyl carrier protein